MLLHIKKHGMSYVTYVVEELYTYFFINRPICNYTRQIVLVKRSLDRLKNWQNHLLKPIIGQILLDLAGDEVMT